MTKTPLRYIKDICSDCAGKYLTKKDDKLKWQYRGWCDVCNSDFGHTVNIKLLENCDLAIKELTPIKEKRDLARKQRKKKKKKSFWIFRSK